MAQTTNYKIISPDSSSVLIPLHSHFAALANSVDDAIVKRFQYKNLLFETKAVFDAAYLTTGKPADAGSSNPDLVDGDVAYVREGKRYFIWNVNAGNGTWSPLLKRLQFDSIESPGRDAYLLEDLTEGDTCYVTNTDTEYYWDGASWQTQTTAYPKVIPTNQFYGPAVFGSTSTALTAGKITYIPFHVPSKGTYDAYNFHYSVGVTSTSLTIGMYAASTTTGLPTGLISNSTVNAATTTPGGASVIATMSSPIVLAPGWYWIGSFVLGGSPTVVTTGWDTARGGNWWMPKPSATYSANVTPGELQDSTTGSVAGTMPANAGTISYGGTYRSPLISVRKSA